MKVEKAMLVYQGGSANVFKVDSFNLSPFGREAQRLHQGGFGECVMFARGMVAAGVVVRTAACNLIGDIVNATWSEDLPSHPFASEMTDVHGN